jgi:tetratricopeptide (TPR) repeat protein
LTGPAFRQPLAPIGGLGNRRPGRKSSAVGIIRSVSAALRSMTVATRRRLDSWKEIATYLARTVRTVQRWERTQALPVHRQLHDSMSSVYAYTDDLDGWRQSRSPVRGDAPCEKYFRRGKYFFEKRTREGLLRAIHEFTKALDENPTWAPPYGGLADAYLGLAGNEFVAPSDAYPQAKAAALEALALDSASPSATTAVGFVHAFYEGDSTGATRHFSAARQLDPSYANAFYWEGMLAMNCGEFSEALRLIRKASELAPLSLIIAANLGRPLLCAGDYVGAERAFTRVIDLDPEFWVAHLLCGFSREAQARYEDAARCYENAFRLTQHAGVGACLAAALARTGRQPEARTILNQLERNQPDGYITPVRLARVYLALGQRETALRHLDTACGDRSVHNNTYLPFDPAFQSLHRDESFRRLIREHWINPSVLERGV